MFKKLELQKYLHSIILKLPNIKPDTISLGWSDIYGFYFKCVFKKNGLAKNCTKRQFLLSIFVHLIHKFQQRIT